MKVQKILPAAAIILAMVAALTIEARTLFGQNGPV